MHRILKIKQILTGTLTTMASLTLISIGNIQSSSAAESYTQSLQELYEMRERIVTKLESLPTPRKRLFSSEQYQTTLEKQQNLVQKLQEIEVQILIEQRANDNWKQALTLGAQAAEVGVSANPTVKTRETEKHLWQQAIYNLQEIPADSIIGEKI